MPAVVGMPFDCRVLWHHGCIMWGVSAQLRYVCLCWMRSLMCRMWPQGLGLIHSPQRVFCSAVKPYMCVGVFVLLLSQGDVCSKVVHGQGSPALCSASVVFAQT